MRTLFSPKRGERFAGESVDRPPGVGPRAQTLVETDGVAVPVEHGPFEPGASPLDRQAGELLEQRTPYAAAAVFGKEEQVLRGDSMLSEEGREDVKEEGKSPG